MNILNMNYYVNTGNVAAKGINLVWFLEDLAKHFGKLYRSDAKYWLNFTTKLMYINNTEAMYNIIKYGVEKNFISFIKVDL